VASEAVETDAPETVNLDEIEL